MSTLIQQQSAPPYIRHIRLTLLCFSVGANALCAGAVFCFPIISPALVAHLKLTQPQLTTIALAGLMGQYPFSAFVGKILDYYGAWLCSLISACLFSTGLGLFAREISKAPDTVTQLEPSSAMFHNLVIFFFISGVGTVFSYFSSVFAASKNFPNYIGVASGTSMALFGLSPTFLSLLASRYFSSPDGEIDVTHFLQFLAVLCGCVHLIGGFTMHIIPSARKEEANSAIIAPDPEVVDERTTLLPNKANADNTDDHVRVDVAPVCDECTDSKQSALDVLSDRNFWALLFVVSVLLGSCEMIISNIGTIVLSLPKQIPTSGDTPSTVLMTAIQVRILSLANTISRLLVGPLADIVSPMPAQDGRRGGFLRRHFISRMSFVTLSAAALVCAFAWMAIGVRDQAGVWVLSIGAGTVYGTVFTVLPSLVSSVWGMSNLGRNYGIITYAPFIGTPTFSYLYAFISNAYSRDGVCYGPLCWRLTFEVSALAAALACGATVYLWRAWKGRV